MHFSDYQEQSRVTAKYPREHHITYPALGLSGEVGELANKIKKIFRDEGGQVTDEKREQVQGEIGDVLWYLAQVATEFDISLEGAARGNLDKLQSRLQRGKIGGSGDRR